MSLHADVDIQQLYKNGEELCGDNVIVTRSPDNTTIVISDGLGSGVKANILATMTTKIASSMLKRNIQLDEVVKTIAETLPVCKVRKIAYSTLQIIKIDTTGKATVVEFDCPPTFFVRDGQVTPFPVEKRQIGDKMVGVGHLQLLENDILVAVSDGVIHAGLGALLKLGWGWKGVSEELKDVCYRYPSVETITRRIAGCCEGYYLGKPGDDTTVVAVKVHPTRFLSLLTGPPKDMTNDEKVIRRFMCNDGKKIIAGGSTANMVGKYLDEKVGVSLVSEDPNVPPIGYLEGIDLVTEGILTLNVVIERLLDKNLNDSPLEDGATLMAKMLNEADSIEILAGTAINPAHQNPNFPFKINFRSQVLGELQKILQNKGKQVHIEWV